MASLNKNIPPKWLAVIIIVLLLIPVGYVVGKKWYDNAHQPPKPLPSYCQPPANALVDNWHMPPECFEDNPPAEL